MIFLLPIQIFAVLLFLCGVLLAIWHMVRMANPFSADPAQVLRPLVPFGLTKGEQDLNPADAEALVKKRADALLWELCTPGRMHLAIMYMVGQLGTILGVFSIVIYCIVLMLAFLVSASIAQSGIWPNANLPLWDIGDFVEVPKGDVYVDVRFQNRIVRFDPSGRFKANYAYPSGPEKSTGLAVSRDGTLFFKARHRIYVVNSELKELSHYEHDEKGDRVWEFREGGVPVHAPHRSKETRPHRAVNPGELLFSDDYFANRRESFVCANSSILDKLGSTIVRTSSSGSFVARYHGPDALEWLHFPSLRPPVLIGIGIAVTLMMKWLATTTRQRLNWELDADSLVAGPKDTHGAQVFLSDKDYRQQNEYSE